MTKVEIDGRTYCVETLIYTVERLTKDVKASAEYHRLVLDKIRAEINKALSAETISDNNQQISDVGIGLELALSIIDKYKAESEVEK